MPKGEESPPGSGAHRYIKAPMGEGARIAYFSLDIASNIRSWPLNFSGKLRKAVRVVNQTLNGLGLEKRPEKTFIGRIEKGFDFLDYHLRPGRLAVAQKTVDRFVERARRLYEQGPGGGLASARLGRYVQRWFRWARAGFSEGVVEVLD